MASRRSPSCFPRKLHTSRQEEKGDTKREKSLQVRRSKRISRLKGESKVGKVDQGSSSAKKDNSPPLPQPFESQKRPREAENPVLPTPIERPQKRPRPASTRPSPWIILGQEATSRLGETQCSHINRWAIGEHVWPTDFFQENEDKMHHIVRKEKPLASLRRKRSESSLVTTTSVTGTDQKARELKSAPYRNPRYELQLETLGIYIRKDGEDITDGSKLLCQKLLKTKQTLPQGTLFEDKLFKATWAAVQNRNECRVIRDLAQLIVPSAENLAIRGAKHLEGLIETLNEGWSNSVPILGPRPQPDYGVGFKRTSFNKDQLLLLEPFVGNYDHLSLFAATYDMFLPFLTAEVKCGTGELEVADRQNAHSMAVGLTGLVELFRLVGREKELHGEVNYFSISHNDHFVTIYGHYAMINGMETTFHRCKIYSFDFTALDGKEKWSAYTFVKNIYDLWVPAHFERICAVIDRLPNKQQVEDTIAMELQALNTTGLSQPLELHDLEVSNSQSGQDDLQTITPNTSIQPESSASSKKKAKSGKAATSKKKGKSGKSTSSKKQGKQTRRV